MTSAHPKIQCRMAIDNLTFILFNCTDNQSKSFKKALLNSINN